mgnify:CR=1 FL=1
MVINLSGELIPDDWAELYRAWGYSAGFFCPSDLRKAMAECLKAKNWCWRSTALVAAWTGVQRSTP